jgi:hypothetical protein
VVLQSGPVEGSAVFLVHAKEVRPGLDEDVYGLSVALGGREEEWGIVVPVFGFNISSSFKQKFDNVDVVVSSGHGQWSLLEAVKAVNAGLFLQKS